MYGLGLTSFFSSLPSVFSKVVIVMFLTALAKEESTSIKSTLDISVMKFT
jgi:hypothetical protein